MRLLFLALSFLFVSLNAFALDPESSDQRSTEVPNALNDWITWIKGKHPEWKCARHSGAYECAWPGSITYKISSHGAEFSLAVEMLNEGVIPLPSQPQLMPHSLRVQSEGDSSVASALFEEEGVLKLKLPRGKFEIKGSFSWVSLPSAYPLPSEYGTVTVIQEDRKASTIVSRSEDSFHLIDVDNSLTEDTLSITLQRLLTDDSPLRLESRIILRVSGGARSQRIGKVLPSGFVPVAIDADIPYQIQKDGTLSVQLSQGVHTVTVQSVMPQPVEALTLPTPDLHEWPNEETIVWKPDPVFRSVEINGAEPLSAELAQLPSEWSGGAAYVAPKGSQLTFRELTRGEQSTAPDTVQLNRELWIDLNGDGYTVRDTFSGELMSSARLEALPETKIGRAMVNGTPVLIAPGTVSKNPGIELRSTTLSVETVSRIEDQRTFSAVGWDKMVQGLTVQLTLPPSWKLLGVDGARSAYGSWISSWTLLDVFLSILIFVASYKLFGRGPAILTGIVLFLTHAEFLAPRMLLVHLMILAAWRKVLADSKSMWALVCKTLIVVTFSAWALQSLAFTKLQVTQLLYPQLQAGTRYRTILQELLDFIEGSLFMWPYLLLLIGVSILALRSIIKGKGVLNRVVRVVGWGAAFIGVFVLGGIVFSTSSRMMMPTSYQTSYDNIPAATAPQRHRKMSSVMGGELALEQALDEAKNVQFSYENKILLSGPALPQWKWRTHHIGVDGPVGPDKKLSLYLLSPGVSRFISLLRAVSMLLLVALIFKALGFSLKRLGPIVMRGSTAMVACFIITAVPARADFPTSDILNELEARIQKNLCQRENCASVLEAEIDLQENTFRARLKVSSQGISAFVFPGPLEVFAPTSIKVNGKPSSALRRNEEDYLVIKTDDGTNTIEVEGNIPQPASFTLQFPDIPLHVGISSDHWYFEGLSPSGTVSESVRFVSKSKEASRTAQGVTPEQIVLPSWVRATRNITVSDQVQVTTTVKRFGDTSRSITVSIPLLPEEHITTPGQRVENGNITVIFPSDVAEISYAGSLPFKGEIKLEAAQTPAVSEEWTVMCAPIVHCEVAGLNPTRSTDGELRKWQWLPFPNEKVTLSITQLSGIAGDLLTVDSATHSINWGANLLEANLNLTLRVTQQQTLGVELPEKAELRSVTVNGQLGSSNKTPTGLNLLLNPGNHSASIQYVLSKSVSLKERVPLVKLSAAAHNVTVTVAPSSDRWLLWTGGVAWGPAVVFWSKLFFVALLCIWLSALGLIPTSKPGALFLGIGLATLPLIHLGIPLLWLALIKLFPELQKYLVNVPRWIVGTGLALLSLVALGLFYSIVEVGLVLEPPMLIAGNQSTINLLRWFVDHTNEALPQPWVLSLSMWWWRAFALVWSTWLVVALLAWLKQGMHVLKDAMEK